MELGTHHDAATVRHTGFFLLIGLTLLGFAVYDLWHRLPLR